MNKINLFRSKFNIFVFIILFLGLLNQFNCVALERQTVLKINKSIYLENILSLMIDLNDSLLCFKNLKQIDIINETGNKYNNLGGNHNYESLMFLTTDGCSLN